ncbi:hypothetical protein PAXINDRAFT_14024 [Paxillus involutus ATCC 200175]|uniref:Uncharacterized protein n=1 Tax=Paxillus involutus ATCC 200175 TaxID=664439 RepID=A0A0C9SV43_PAXIN|nr:hypothetical protein PAXINDRAFT_14024 [Paxillus involutus ATCC 200175]
MDRGPSKVQSPGNIHCLGCCGSGIDEDRFGGRQRPNLERGNGCSFKSRPSHVTHHISLTYVIGGRWSEVVIWNSDDSDQLPPTHLATSSWDGKTTFIFDISTGKQRPAIPLAGPSRNDGRGLDPFWDSLPNLAQQASPQPQRVLNKVRNTFASIFTRNPAVATQTTPVRDTVEPVEVMAGRDRPFWVVLERITWTPVTKMIFVLFFCRQPGPQERGGFAPINRHTRPNSSQTRAGNVAATKSRSGHPETGCGVTNEGAGPSSSPPVTGNLPIHTQPERTSAAEPRPSATPAPKSQIRNQTKSIKMATTSEISPMPAHQDASRQPTPSKESLSLAVTPREPSSTSFTAIVLSTPLSISSGSPCPASARSSSHDVDIPSMITLSPIQIAIIKEYRRRQATADLENRNPSVVSPSAEHRATEVSNTSVVPA